LVKNEAVGKTTGDPLVGTDVAHYHVEARLGGGGMGVVYAARDTKLGRRVALKFLPPQWSHDESAKQRFIREAQAASATDHPNICTIHDIGTAADGQLFIVMAHYAGQTLKARLEGGRLTVDEAVDIAAQVAEGLAKAHSQGVIHRDIKPGNLMLTEDGVKILDFGLAKFADARLKLTLEGSTIGTIAYMSPEQARGEEADARSDVWAVGVVLYEMLTGDVPFKGGYPEAISHAIRNDPPSPIRSTVPEVPETLEQLVFRTLYKERGIRIQSARELARALRHLQGRTLPFDRTEALPLGDARGAAMPPRGRWRSRRVAAVAATLAFLTMGMPIWIFSPVDRVPVAVAPVVNQTGYDELDPYRLALTRELSAQLADSAVVRVLPHDRLVQIMRRFRLGGGDVSSRESLQALTSHSGATMIIVPTLLYESGGWRARVELRDAGTATNVATYTVDAGVSSLMRDTAYGLMPALASRIDAHFNDAAPRRAVVAEALRRFAGWASAAPPRLRTLDAAAEFEQGLDAFEQQEYPAAARLFAAASGRDERSPLLLAWRSRAARVMRLDNEAADAGDQATRRLIDQTPRRDRLFVEAVAAEARQDVPAAEARYRDLVAEFPDEPGWIMELAAFQDRVATADATAQAIGNYLSALRLDNRLARADLELCRLYGPARQNEPLSAREHGTRALSAFRSMGNRAGEAQALICLTDVLRVGRDEDRREASANAEAALRIFSDLESTYNLPRAAYALAMGAAARGDIPNAAALFERSLADARAGGNRVLEPLLLMNLGVAQVLLGNRAEAVDYYQASSDLYEALGDQQRAAAQQANSAALRIEYADRPADALRDVQNALGVFQKLGDRNFEAFCLQLFALYYRQAGRHADAERELNRALAILRERNLEDDIGSVTIDRALSQIDLARYPEALRLLGEALAAGTGRRTASARIHLARVHLRLGDGATSAAELVQASDTEGAGNDSLPLLLLVQGELAGHAGRVDEARRAFERASSLWTGPLPDAASVEARANLGYLDAVAGRPVQGRLAVETSLKQAQLMERFALEARCRLLLARIDLGQRQFDAALRTLDAIPPDDDMRTIGAELRAQVHYWRAQALMGGGAAAAAQAEIGLARKMIDGIREALPEAYRPGFLARPEVQRIIG
jgi:tetratricopeptide (TPR) repeat protein